MFKIAFKQKPALCNFYLLILFTTTILIIDNKVIDCRVITRRDILIKNETTEVESKILQEENKLTATTTTKTPIQLYDNVASDLIVNEKRIKEDASTFRTEITTVSETRSESFSIATKTPKILTTSTSTTTTTKTPIKLINENSININSNSIKDNDNSKTVTDTTIITTITTTLPTDTATTTQISNLNINNEKSNANNLNDIAKENYVKNSEINTETSENVVQTTTQMPDEPDTTIKQDLFRDDSQLNIESTTIEPIESMTKIFDSLDYDDMKIKVITSTTEKNQYETLVTTNKYSNNQISITKELETLKETIVKELENDLANDKAIFNETKSDHKSELEHKIIKLESKSKSFKSDNVLEEKIENELSPSKSEGRNNKYDDILAEVDIDEKHLEKENDLKLNPKNSSTNQEITTISNDLEIPNAAEFWALAGMKTNLQKEKFSKLENKTNLKPEYVNIEQDNSTLKHLTDWSKIMEESIDMENSTTSLVDDLITTTILPDIEEKSKISIDSISNNLNENSEKEILIKQFPTITTTTTTTSATVEEVKIIFNSTTPSTNLNILKEHSNNFGNDSSESISKFNKEKFQSKSNQMTDISSGSNSININTTNDNTSNSHDENLKQNLNLNLNTKVNDNDRIFTNSNASSVKNIYSDLKNGYDKINEENKTMKATEKNDEVDLNLMPKLNKTQEDNNFNKINSSSLSSSSSTTSTTPSSVIELVQNENIINSSEIITKTTTIPPTILSSSTPSSSSSSAEFQTTTGTRGLSFENSLKAHPNKEDIIDDLNNTVTLNNAFKNNSSDKYLEIFYNNSIQQNQHQHQNQQQPPSSSTTINRNSNLTENSKLSTAVENSLNENENKNETNSIYTNIINNNNNNNSNNNNKNNSYIEGKENLNNKIILKTNESDINNDISIKKEIFIATTTTTTTEKQQNKQEEVEAAEEEEDIELKMTSRMDYDDENTTTTKPIVIKPTTEFYFDKSSKKNQKYQLNGLSTESPTLSVTTGSENIKKKFTTEKTEKPENAKSTSESSIENDIIEKNQPPTTKSSLFPKLIQPTINPLKNLNNNNNEEIILENSLDAQSTLQTIPFAKDPTDILIGSPSPSIPTSEINSDPNLNPNLYPKYEVATTNDSKLETNINNGTKTGGAEDGGGLSATVNADDKNCDPSSTKIPYSNTIEGLEGAANDTDYNVIIAVSVSVVGIIALILLVGFLIVMRKRQKQTTYGQRCRPVGLDAYSVDNLSLRDSIRGKSFRSSFSKRSYGNVAFDDPNLINNIMSIHELNRFIAKKSAIYDEFKDIPQITAKPDEVPPGCEDKNRYANVIPLPETRVILQQQGGDEKTEYINANYVRGPKDSPNYYIACQAPLESTVPDFWRMIWEQNSRVVIMATDLEENGIEKSAAYIPESITLDNHVSFGDYQITLKNREVKEKYAVSTLHVKNLKTNAWREITHFWYQWPITGVPQDEAPMIAMLLEARSCLKSAANEQIDDEEILENNDTNKTVTTDIDKKMNGENGSTIKSEQQINESNKNEIGKNNKASSTKSQGPLLIHCSPGTGRTGTIIACDIAIRSLETPKRSINIPQIVYYVRRGRASSILTREQYEFIYRVTHMYATKISAPVNDN